MSERSDRTRYGVAFGPQGVHWGTDRAEAMFTVFLSHGSTLKDWQEMYGDIAAICEFDDEFSAKAVACRSIAFAPIPTHYKARLLAWHLGGFQGEPPKRDIG